MTTPSERARQVAWQCLGLPPGEIAALIDAFAAEAVRAEREACARIAGGPGGFDVDNNDQLQARIASAIRARTPASGEEGKITTPVPCPDCGSEKEYCPCTTPKAPRP